ncbi:MAG: M48 family peptidase [Deltaproteobacteria bacterium]|nr:MAG: M48 family peptidase [Deltaproteobacteria bacterium]
MVVFNGLLIAFLILFTITAICRWLLPQINIRHLQRHGHEIPDVFRGEIDRATLAKITDYTIESSRFRSFETFFDDILILLILLSGFLPWLLSLILFGNLHFVLSGLIFLGVIVMLSGLLGVPFTLYNTFVIEKRHGFSTITFKLWLTDLMKGLVVSTILMMLLLGSFLSLLYYAPKTWWFWVWLVFAIFQLLMLWLYPVLIAPLFNKYEPVKDESLKDAIVALMARVGLKTEGVYQVDEGKRTKHTNAYFTGLGKTKRIVLFDTLLEAHAPDEILSVLAHEIGHWKKKHILMQLVFMEAASLFGFYLAYKLVDWPLMHQTFGFHEVIPYVGLLLLGILFGPLFFFISPVWAMITRKFEREADEFAFGLTGTNKPFTDALKRLAKDNLANLHPHPFYAWFYYSHPPLTERIARLLQMKTPSASRYVFKI